MSENLLRHEASPYLLQHADNPVHWRPWGPAALAEAQAAGKPILLSIGYAACHWCHVMAHESFEDPATAAVMNRLFVNIKVDREERPEVDQIYMSALHALGEQGGWPLTMFLKSDGKPIWGGTYFPKTSRYGRPAFVDVLEEVARIHRDEPEKINHNSTLLMEHLAERPAGDAVTLDESFLHRAALRLLELVDKDHGGIRGAPKFPQAGLFDFLWRSGIRSKNRDLQEAVLITLRNIAQGGIYDHVGGGFSRYSVDDRWLVPHFEKMLYDNAQLIELMTHAWLATGDDLFRARIEETIAWIQREMMVGTAVSASLDADSDGHEGRFYVWTRDEVISVLGHESGARFCNLYDITAEGNWEGVSIPNRLGFMRLLPAQEEASLASLRTQLLAHRETRNRPARDDKILADWNGLAISAIAFAGATFERDDWIKLAEAAFRFVTESMTVGDRLAHSYRGSKTVFPGLATDYAAMIRAALSLHAATFDPAYLDKAETFAATLRRHHWDAEVPGYYLSADDAEALIVRPRSTVDEATPSANGMMATNLVRLWHLTGKDDYRRDADDLIAASAPFVAGNLFAATALLGGLDLRLAAIEVVIIAPSASSARDLIRAARRYATPDTILSVHDDLLALPPSHPAAGKTAVDDRPTAYVCRGQTCSLPVTDAKALVELLT